jgi:hypothetical protein
MTANPHATSVDAWLKHSAHELSRPDLIRLFAAALDALWNVAVTTLGHVTLTAIAERVLFTASEKFPVLSSLKVEAAHGFQCGELRKPIDSLQASELIEMFRFVLVELLTVHGRLTAEILSSELHAELQQVSLPTASHAKPSGAAPPGRRRQKDRAR